MKASAGKKKYPYSRNRVYLSTTIAVLSLLLAVMVFQSYPTSMPANLLYFLLSALAFTTFTFLLKMRLYPLITESTPTTGQSHGQPKSQSTWKMLLLVFCIMISSIFVPILLAGVLGGAVWFILMTSFMLGVSISEILFYLYTL
jgi:hypothetical protein